MKVEVRVAKAIVVSIVLFAFSFASNVLSDEPLNRQAIAIALELLDVYYGNAESFRNYDVSIEKIASFNLTEKESKEDSLLSYLSHRIAIDWEIERCLIATHSYTESASSEKRWNELRFIERFENGVAYSKQLGFEKRPRVQNSTFHSFMKKVPVVEMMGLQAFPACFDKPIAQAREANKKRILAVDIGFRYLPDGTGVRTTKSPMGITTTHFDSKSSMPVYISAVYSDTRIPPSSSSISYELHEGIYRPTEIKTREHMMLSDESTKSDGSNIKFLNGYGDIKFRWHRFNEEFAQLPDDSVLNGTKVSWDKFIDSKEAE